jgi:hypothetical protein
MYKKRLRSWGLSKHVKADKKYEALARILFDESITHESDPIRYDKLVRYAKSRVKSGALDAYHLDTVMKHDRLGACARVSLSPFTTRHATTTTTAVSMSRSLAPPDETAHLDVFLRAMTALIERERAECQIGPPRAPDAIFVALTTGMAHWRNNAFASARRSFSQAAQKTTEDLHGTVVLVSRITYCISSILWGSEREVVFHKFADFLANAALEVLGQACPLTIVLQHLRRHLSLDTQVTIWKCALDDYQISEQNAQHWWGMAQRRWRWCQRSGLHDLAARYCRFAMSEARRIDKLTDKMEMEAQQDLESIVAEINTPPCGRVHVQNGIRSLGQVGRGSEEEGEEEEEEVE